VVPQQPSSRFSLGPFYGFDSLRHYEYSFTMLTYTPIENVPDSLGRLVTAVGYLVQVLAPGPDTIRLWIGTRRMLTLYVGNNHLDTTYDTFSSNSTYVRAGDSFKALGPPPPFPFLDRAYVTDRDTVSLRGYGTGFFRIDNLDSALRGGRAECTHFFGSIYAGSGRLAGASAMYRQGIGMTAYIASGGSSSEEIRLVAAEP